MQQEAHITVNDLTMAYGDFVIQRDLSFTVNRGDVFIIMGGSGCGKSTLMRHMIGLKAPAKGSVLYGATDFWAAELDLDLRSLKAERGPHVRYLPDVQRFLEAVRQRVPRVVLVTNAHHGALEVKLARTGLDGYLDSIYTAHDFGHPKEDQAFWVALQAAEQIQAPRCLLVDDSLPVLEAAQKFGIGQMFTIRRPDTGQPPRRLSGRFLALGSLMDLLE